MRRHSLLPKAARPFRARLPSTCSLAALSWLALSGAPAHAEDLSGMAKRLSELRSEVEAMSDELSAAKDEGQEQLRSYARQKSELELEIQREETRLAKLQQAIQAKQAEAESLKQANQGLAPAFEKHIATVRAYVRQSLPFRVKERLAELDKLEEQVKTSVLSPQRGLNRLWSFVEDEIRMTKESGLFSQPVDIEGKEQLAEVARLGMVVMYYRTPDDQFGSTVYEDGQWRFRAIGDEDARKQVRSLFESFKKQIRVGYFELPNALPPVAQ